MTSAAAAVPPLSIGQVAEAAAVNVQTLRYYERVGLVPAPKRSRAGYRQYTDEAVRVVSFVKRAQELGFTLKEIRELLKFRMAGVQRRDAVRAAATAKVADLDARIQDLIAIRAALASLVKTCSCQSKTPACPILEALEEK
jgi:DNA-binding transcriptional MerR regulator